MEELARPPIRRATPGAPAMTGPAQAVTSASPARTLTDRQHPTNPITLHDGERRCMASNTPILPVVSPSPKPGHATGSILALDLGTSMGWALRLGTETESGSRCPSVPAAMTVAACAMSASATGSIAAGRGKRRAPGCLLRGSTPPRRDRCRPIYGGFLACLTAWCEERGIADQGVPVGTIKRHVTAKGNADKQAVIDAVRTRGFTPADGNEADAIAILSGHRDANAGAPR